MDRLRACCNDALKFPMKESLLDSNINEDSTLSALSLRLKERQKILFQDNENDATSQRLHFLETNESGTGLLVSMGSSPFN
jgi:hypothetical protein